MNHVCQNGENISESRNPDSRCASVEPGPRQGEHTLDLANPVIAGEVAALRHTFELFHRALREVHCEKLQVPPKRWATPVEGMFPSARNADNRLLANAKLLEGLERIDRKLRDRPKSDLLVANETGEEGPLARNLHPNSIFHECPPEIFWILQNGRRSDSSARRRFESEHRIASVFGHLADQTNATHSPTSDTTSLVTACQSGSSDSYH